VEKVPLKLEGACVLQQQLLEDQRGFFSRLFSKGDLAVLGIDFEIEQVNYSLSLQVGIIRGLHYQVAPKAEAKIFKCISGRVFDVIVDVRKDSPTFLQWHGQELREDSHQMLLVPEGFAHGVQSLEENSEIIYFSSEAHSGEHEHLLRFDEPRVNIQWPILPPTLSPKDQAAPYLSTDFEGIVV
jgi:dTDP-4-dehydrorhamnose 3,5-epimerase